MDALQQLNALIDDNENVLWYGKPNKKCFLLEAVFNPLLPFALLWGLIDFAFIGLLLSKGQQTNQPPLLMLIPFFALHLMPVWIYLAGVLLAFKNHKNTCFAVTEKGIYASEGFFSRYFRHKPFAEIADVSVRQGFFDRKLNVGDVIITDKNAASDLNDMQKLQQAGLQNAAKITRIAAGGLNKHAAGNNIIFHDIADYLEVYHLIRQQLAAQSK